jgi:cytochrome c biogenesis factor
MDINDILRALIVICGTLLVFSFRKSNRKDIKVNSTYIVKRFIIIFIICLLPISCYYILKMYMSIVATTYITLALSVIILIGLIVYYIWEDKRTKHKE